MFGTNNDSYDEQTEISRRCDNHCNHFSGYRGDLSPGGYRTHSRTSSATTGGFGRRPNAGYKFQFITLAGFHALNYSMFQLARGYKESGMSAYAELQEAESALPRSIR